MIVGDLVDLLDLSGGFHGDEHEAIAMQFSTGRASSPEPPGNDKYLRYRGLLKVVAKHRRLGSL